MSSLLATVHPTSFCCALTTHEGTLETLAIRVPVIVGPTAEVMFEGMPYGCWPAAHMHANDTGPLQCICPSLVRIAHASGSTGASSRRELHQARARS